MELWSSSLWLGRQLWSVRYIPVGGISLDSDLHSIDVNRHCPWAETGSHSQVLSWQIHRKGQAWLDVRSVTSMHLTMELFSFGSEKWVNWETLGTVCSSGASLQCPGSLCSTSGALPWNLTILSYQRSVWGQKLVFIGTWLIPILIFMVHKISSLWNERDGFHLPCGVQA